MPTTKSRFPSQLEHACTLNGQKPLLKLDRSRLLLVFKKSFKDKNKVQQILIRNHVPLVLETPLKNHASGSRSDLIINHTDRRFWVRTVDNKPLSENLRRSLGKKLQSHLAWIAPVYQTPGILGQKGIVAPVADTLLIKPRRQAGLADDDTIRAVTTKLGTMKCVTTACRPVSNLEDEGYVPFVVIRPDECAVYKLKSKQVTALTGPIDEMQLDFMPLVSTVAWSTPVTKDPLSSDQWNLTATRWDKVYQQGAPSTLGQGIIVAVLDRGCDLDHPDLQIAYALGATFHGPTEVTVSRGRGGHDTDGATHGTCCAGIIAAQCDNNIGISGLAPGCQIMPIRLELDTAAELGKAIEFACDNKANVISISKASPHLDTDYVRSQIRRAVADGVVICASAGNDSGSALSYPAADRNVIACSAITQTGVRCITSNWPASGDANFGNGLSVVAPGVAIPTTIHSAGPGGHWPADYRIDFYGTSAAAPHVAALAAIILSTKPKLTPGDVRDIIEHTAQQLGNYAFKDTPQDADGNTMPPRRGWDKEVGYGLINFEAAITQALTYP